MDLFNYLPELYKDVLEFSELIKSENFLFEQLKLEKNKTINNIYITTCDISTIKKYEALLGIYDTSNIDLNFRRQRVLNRLNMSIPFTLEGLNIKLNELLGEKDFEVKLDYDKYTISILSKNLNQEIFTETYIALNKMIPVNMIFITEPILPNVINFNETITSSQVEFNYKFGKWHLGQKTFGNRGEESIIKEPNKTSINPKVLDEFRENLFNSISYIKLNDSLKINSFITKAIIDNSIVIEYSLPKDIDFNVIEKVAVYDSSDELKSSAKLNIPCMGRMAIQHVTKIYEGV